MNGMMKMIITMLVARRSRGEPWEAGDLAVCIADNWTEKEGEHPKLNQYFRVKHVCGGGLWLHFEGKPAGVHYEANAFRKVRPDTEPAVDAEWVEQLQRLRRRIDA